MTPLITIVIVAAGLIAIALLVRVGHGKAGSQPVLLAPCAGVPIAPVHVPVNRIADPADKLTLEQKLANLEQCGLKLAEPFTVDDLLSSWPRSEYEKPGYECVLFAIGSCEEREPWRQLCDSFYTFDVECIEDEDAYKTVLEPIAAMTKGDMRLSDFLEKVDWEDGMSHLSFKCNGKPFAIEFKQDNDWFNEHVFDQVLRLLKTTGSKRVFFTRDTGDQNCEVGCLFPEQIEQLRQLGLELDEIQH